MASKGLISQAVKLLGDAIFRDGPQALLDDDITLRKPSRNRSRDFRQPSTLSFSRWSIDTVRSALEQHERGEFARSAQLAEAMGRDDRIAGCMNVRLNALCGINGVDFAIVPPDNGPQELADKVDEWWFDVVPDAVLRQILADVVYMGFAVVRKHWKLTGKSWQVSELERWNPGFVRWDEFRRQFAVQTESGVEIWLEDGDPEWVVFTPAGERSWMASAVRALGFAYVMRQWNWRDWTRFNERHGQPIIAVKEPPEFEDGAKDRFYSSLKNMGSTGVIRLPQGTREGMGFDLEFKEAKDGAFETFQKFRNDLDVCIAVFLLGQNLTTEVSGGSFAAAGVHARIAGFILAADAEALSTPLRYQVIVPWCVFNFAAGVKDCPWPQWDTETPEDLAAASLTLVNLGKAIQGLIDTGLPLDALELAGRFNVPLKEGEEMGEPYRKPEPTIGKPGEDAEPAPGKAKGPKALLVPQNAASGFVEGQLWVDDLTEDVRKKAAEALEPFLVGIRACIKKSKDMDELRANLLEFYQGTADPARMRQITQIALVMGGLGGRASAQQDF